MTLPSIGDEVMIASGDATLYLGDCIEVMRGLPDNSVDSIVTDPPYHLTQNSRGGHARTNNPEMPHGRHRIGDKGFMGKVWDGGDIAHRVEMWAECLRVLKPGGHLLAFAGSRTYHRMTCAIEDAGFEIRDQIMWIYGSGFPKSRNLKGEHEGWGTALKPSHEPICMARKPLIGTVEANVLAHRTGAINIDACRIATDDTLHAGAGTSWEAIHRGEGRATREGEQSAERRYSDAGSTNFAATPGPRGGDARGRWPANVIHDGCGVVLAAFPQSDTKNSAKMGSGAGGIWGASAGSPAGPVYDDAGSAARFFYCAKTSREDRNEGCSALPDATGGMVSNTSGQHITRRDGWVPEPVKNNHPTVKPTDLMAYLCRLITPPGGTVLDPFMGSGSTGKAAIAEGFKFIGIDMTPEYVEIAKARIAHEQAKPLQQRMFA